MRRIQVTYMHGTGSLDWGIIEERLRFDELGKYARNNVVNLNGNGHAVEYSLEKYRTGLIQELRHEPIVKNAVFIK